MKNSKVKAVQLSTELSEPAERSDFELQLIQEARAKQSRFIALGLDKGNRKFTKISDEIAQSDHYIRNEPIPHGLDLFPATKHLWYMRYSDLFYAYAKGGPLYIDTPGSSTEVMYCEIKLKAYNAAGVRYTYIKANEDAAEAHLRIDPILKPGVIS